MREGICPEPSIKCAAGTGVTVHGETYLSCEEDEGDEEDKEDGEDEEEEKGEKKKEEPVPLKWVLKYYIFVNQAFCEVSLQYQYLYDSKIFQEAKE